ncbi:hypothetical protein C8R42DRAFT_728490 [Lentinula raphanica]|nr:hypothetical protein C8R42DRAFT_728490 [Lentinula raphanica]
MLARISPASTGRPAQDVKIKLQQYEEIEGSAFVFNPLAEGETDSDGYLPIIDLDLFLGQSEDDPAVQKECQKATDALITFGALILCDSRNSESNDSTFLDLLEGYFAQPQSNIQKDEHGPDLNYQVESL